MLLLSPKNQNIHLLFVQAVSDEQRFYSDKRSIRIFSRDQFKQEILTVSFKAG
ncbi:hypothetical protein [Mucilaginibacter arboris]|uniref:Uncharacterized protein n=1 Tax=Mucilaginibacter arboris TaxID=2682090 RepID=A0A7K1SUR2_9SPHI|nr:hypothetical protein [Mucilaginibacter arboris]MVN20780.1 hypothetical protein [Mucilaginibacter arboris]